LRFDIQQSNLPIEVQTRLIRLAGKRVTANKVLIITAQKFRTQLRNREDALTRLLDLIKKSKQKPKLRKKTKVPKAEKQKRVENKKRRSEIKKWRRNKSDS
jgi:ribosome-associated protein